MSHTPGTFCTCSDCTADRELSLADSRATSAIQAAAWHPRSRRLQAAAHAAVVHRDTLAEARG